MGCCNCKFLDENNVRDGNVSGCCYFCKKRKCYVTGNSTGCDYFSNDYSRSSYMKDEIYYNGEKFYDDFTLSKEDSWLVLKNRRDYINDELLKELLAKISEVTDYFTFYLLKSYEKTSKGNNELIEEVNSHYPNIKAEDQHNNTEWSFIKYTLNIDDALKSISKE